MKNKKIVWLLFAACPLLSYGQASHAESNNFQLGQEAYKAENYQQALEYFNLAWGDGGNDASLAYNRAVCYYKLDQLEAAKKAFSSLLVNSQWIHLARYNLARISEQQNQYSKAYNWYNKVALRAKNPSLQRLAKARLRVIQPHITIKDDDTETSPNRSAGFVSIAYAVDSNATGLAEEFSSEASDVSDTYLRLFGYAHHYMSGEKNNGVKLYGLAQVRRFQKFDSYDSSIVGAGLDYEKNLLNTDVTIGSSFNSISTSTGLLANQLSLKTKLVKLIGEGRVQGEYHARYYAAADNYNHLDGRQHYFSLGWQQALSRFIVSPSVSWESNGRRDKYIETTEAGDSNFFSYSPNILGLHAKLQWKFSVDWNFYSNLSYRSATYRSADVHKDIATQEIQQVRDATRLDYTLGTRYKMNDIWYIKAEYKSSSNSESYDLYSYDKNLFNVMLDLTW